MKADLNSPKQLRWEARQIKRAQRGDRRALAALYEAFADPLYARVLLPSLGDPTAAEDALAEAFRAAFEQLSGFEPRGVSLWFWLARIGKNKALDIHRKRQRAARALASYERLLEPLWGAPDAPDVTLSRREEEARLRAALGEAMGRLNPRYRQVLELRLLQELPRGECAARMEVKIGTLDVLVLRALRSLRKALGGDEG